MPPEVNNPNQSGGGGSSSGGSSSGGSSSSGGATTTAATYGGSSGSSAPAGPSEAELRAMRNLRHSFLEVLHRLGIKENKNLLNLVERGVRGLWSTTIFMSFLRQTKEYKQQFRGILMRQGMTESQYLSMFAQFKARAKDVGLDMGKQMFAQFLKKGISFEEFSARVDALNAIQEYAPFWKQFGETLEMRGVPIPGQRLTKKELAKFLMGMGSKAWEKVYQEMIVTVNLEKVAGISVIEKRQGESATDDPYAINRKDMLDLIRKVEALSPGFEVEKLTSQDWANIGKKLREFQPEYLKRYGLSTEDVLTIELGGPGAAALAEKADRVLATQAAYFEERVTPQFANLQQAAGGGGKEALPQSQ